VVVIGCGPVGLCALINAESYKPKHLLAVDSVQSRLDLAKSLGAEPWNFQTDREGLDKRVKELTDGRGADVIIEVVGLSPALKMGFELLRPWGVISSVGVHNGEASTTLSLPRIESEDCPDPMEWKPGLWQESQDPNGQVPSAVHIPSSIGYAETKAAPLRV